MVDCAPVAWLAQSQTRTRSSTSPNSCVQVVCTGERDHQVRPSTCAWSSDTNCHGQIYGHKTFAKLAAVANHQSVGAKQDGVSGSSLDTFSRRRFQRAVRTDHRCIPWFVRHSAWCITRYLVKPCGRGPYETLNNKRHTGEVVFCGCDVCKGAR